MGVLKPKLGEAVSYRLRAGQPAAHHPWTPHCSGENTTEQPRRVLLIRLLPLELARRYQDIHGAPIALASWRAGWRRRTPARPRQRARRGAAPPAGRQTSSCAAAMRARACRACPRPPPPRRWHARWSAPRRAAASPGCSPPLPSTSAVDARRVASVRLGGARGGARAGMRPVASPVAAHLPRRGRESRHGHRLGSLRDADVGRRRVVRRMERDGVRRRGDVRRRWKQLPLRARRLRRAIVPTRRADGAQRGAECSGRG